jgi:hypothetical protein
MQPMWANIAALTVAIIYYTWRNFDDIRRRRDRLLRERVAYMLWTIATRANSGTREIPRVTV